MYLLSLKAQGFNNVQIFEREKRIGGKVYDINHRGLVQQMTFYYILPEYYEVKELIGNYSSGTEKLQPRKSGEKKKEI